MRADSDIVPRETQAPEMLRGSLVLQALTRPYRVTLPMILADPPYNCFPSLQVAHSFVSALTCRRRLHRGLGSAAIVAAAQVGLSTFFTEQHYVLDVVAGMLLALAA